MNKSGYGFKQVPEIGVVPYSEFEDAVRHNIKTIKREMTNDLKTIDEIAGFFDDLSKDINANDKTIEIEQLKMIYAVSKQLETFEGAFSLMERNLDTLGGIFTGETRIEMKKQ